jgi:hypothetical protein
MKAQEEETVFVFMKLACFSGKQCLSLQLLFLAWNTYLSLLPNPRQRMMGKYL